MSEVVPLFAQAGLDACDREPIHIPGSIQPHGVLLVVDREDFIVREYAGDIRFMLGLDAARLRQMSLSGLFDQHVALQIDRHVRQAGEFVPPAVLLGINSQTGSLPLDITVHACHKRVVVELEPARRSVSTDGDPLSRVTSMIARLSAADDVVATCAVAAATVRDLFGFDRVSVYQFLADDSGKVIAESRAAGIEGYLDLHFPASDIPAQAREMYRRTWLRSIPDIEYTPAPLLACPGVQVDAPLDMTHCCLRSVSPIHLEYLRNMGVLASVSLSIVVDGKLWGLIACHHCMPRYLATDLRAAGELYAQIFSLHLTAKIQTDAAQRRIAPRAVQAQLANRVPLAADFLAELVDGEVSVLNLMEANGVAVLHQGRLLTRGQTPPEELILSFGRWLDDSCANVFHSHCWSREFAPAADCMDTACGVLAVAVSRDPSNYVMWFRPELARSVSWAGHPSKPLEAGPNGLRLTPRKSFEAWQDEVRGQSLPWDDVDVDAAVAFRIWLLETVLRQMEAARREREAMFARQHVLMAELDHRVKNSLAVIQSMVHHSKASARTFSEFASDLERRIVTMGYAHAALGDRHWDGASLRKIIDNEMALLKEDVRPRVHVEGEDCGLSATATMSLAMVIHELVTNAQRYGALSLRDGAVHLNWSTPASNDALVLVWKEQGGPAVAEPIRRGFGSMLIERSLNYQLQGSGAMVFAPDGLLCTMMIPHGHLVKFAQEE